MKQLEKGKLKVVLLEDVPKLGHAGDNKEVAPGYARNYLFPRHLATLATQSAMRQAEETKRIENKHQQKTRVSQEELAKKVDGLSLKISAKAGAEGKLFGSITSALISEKLKQATGYTVDRRKITLPERLRYLGTYDIKLRIAPDLTPGIKLEIVAEQ